MDKRADRKSYRTNGSSKAKIGIPLGIHDQNGNELHTGDHVKWGCYTGIFLYDYKDEVYRFCIDGSKWYGDNEYDADSYGKGFELRMDDGARMEMKLIK